MSNIKRQYIAHVTHSIQLTFGVCLSLLFGVSTVYAQDTGSMMQMDSDIDVSDVRICDSRNPASWRDAQTLEGVSIEDDPSCYPDMPALVAASVKGTNNVSSETLNATGMAPDAVIKENDKDGDGDPDVIRIHLEISGLNEGEESITPHEIAPGITPGFWVFTPKSTGMATEGMSGAYLMRMPSPTIRVEQGDEVYVTVENTHYMPHTIHFHGVDHPYLDSEGEGNDGVPQTSEMPIQPGEQRTYNMNPRVSGSMAYHCHVKPDVHVLMGLSGLFIVEENRPNNSLQTFNVGNGKVRHRSVVSRALYNGEFDLEYQDVDKEMHELVQGTNDPGVVTQRIDHEYDITDRTADYFLLNGKSFPYTLRESQLIVDPDNKYLLRVLNIGSETVSLHTHGHKVLVKALDGINVSSPYYRDVVDIHSAQRADLVLNTTDDGLNSYGEGVWLFHDHEESHITTDGVSPGGGLSMITYRSFLDERGMPMVQGMDIRQYFTPEFYDRSDAVRGDVDDGSTLSLKLLPLIVALLGVCVGIGLGAIFLKRRRGRESQAGLIRPVKLFQVSLVTFTCVFLLVSAETVFSVSSADMEGIEGIHIMPDGSVMLGTGETLDDTTIADDGMIILGSGEIVKPLMDMRPGGNMEMPATGEPKKEGSTMESSGSADPSTSEEPLMEEEAAEEEVSDIMMGSMDMGDGEVATETSHLGMEGMDGIHVMPNGRVMTGAGVWLDDATVRDDGIIVLGSGEIIEPILDMRRGGGIRRTENTMVVNENFDQLPLGCSEISGEKHITVTAGTEIAEDFPGTVYTYDTHSIEDIEPCTLLTVTFVNKDDIRHQFMVHDLPPDTYAMGMFNIEVTGPGEETGTFITPPGQDTLFVHCGVPEHEAKGMVAQIKNGGGDGDLPGIPGITRDIAKSVGGNTLGLRLSLYSVLGVFLGLLLYYLVILRRKQSVP